MRIDEEHMERESNPVATIRTDLPEFAKACTADAEAAVLHQDAFAAYYQYDEYMLLGMTIKYAGLRGKQVCVIVGSPGSPVGRPEPIRRESEDLSLASVNGSMAVRTVVASIQS